MRLQVFQRERAARVRKLHGHARGEPAPVETVSSLAREGRKRFGQPWLKEQVAGCWYLPVRQKGTGELGPFRELFLFGPGAVGLTLRHGNPVARQVDGILQQAR